MEVALKDPKVREAYQKAAERLDDKILEIDPTLKPIVDRERTRQPFYPEAEPAARFRLGEDIVHAAFGDGVVTGVEPGGVVVVRFAQDGSERKLMAEYAPLSRR